MNLRREKVHLDQRQLTPPPVYKQRPSLDSRRSWQSYEEDKPSSGDAVTDSAVTTSEIVRLVVGQALGLRIEEIKDLDTIRGLAGGQSDDFVRLMDTDDIFRSRNRRTD